VRPIFRPLQRRSHYDISPRETDVLEFLALGLTNKEMAEQLGLSEETVKSHVKSVLMKTRSRNRVQAAVWAVKHGYDRSEEGS
jgi:DNA-binding NarL/FixJ family response regulator